jgi:hypothetical protein
MEKREDNIQGKITELIAQIQGMPEPTRQRLMELAHETQARHEQIKATFSQLQEGIDYLRLHVKYLLFDLEATRRENVELRKILKSKN